MLAAASQQLAGDGERGDGSASWQAYFCDELGFASVDIRSFKSGSVSTTDDDSGGDDTANDDRPAAAASFG